MVDLIQIAAEFLKIDPMLVSEYMREGTVQGIFYLFFFPSVFLFLFVITLMNAKGPSRNDLKLLVTVSIYAFIVMSGYYTWFVWLSKWWLYLMIILGVWYMIMAHKSKGGIDKVDGLQRGGGGHDVSGLQRGKMNPVAAKAERDVLVKEIRDLNQLAKDSRNIPGAPMDANITSMANSIEQRINIYENSLLGVGATNFLGMKNSADRLRSSLSKARTGHL